jgi:hypothetical protein
MLIREPEKEQRLVEWFIPPATFAMALLSWLWWLESEPFRPFVASFLVFGLVAFAYEIGYKFFKLHQRRPVFFVLAFILPLTLGALGALGGFLFARVV